MKSGADMVTTATASISPGMKILRALIVEDEPLGYRRLFDVLDSRPDVRVVGWARNGSDAVKAIKSLEPDVVFLDVQMPGSSGLDVIRSVGPDRMPATVFVSAHDRYAFEAFQLAAADYLKKPYSDERIEEALKRVRRYIETGTMQILSERLDNLMRNRVSHPAQPARTEADRYLARISVESHGKLRVIPVPEIYRIHADGPYSELFTAENKYLVRESIGSLEEKLDPRLFCRLHRSELVALDFIDSYLRRGGTHTIQLKNGDRLPVGRSYRKELERRLGCL